MYIDCSVFYMFLYNLFTTLLLNKKHGKINIVILMNGTFYYSC